MNNQDLNLTIKIKPYSNLEITVLTTQITQNPLHKLLTAQTINYSMLKLVTLNCAIPTQTNHNIAINYAQERLTCKYSLLQISTKTPIKQSVLKLINIPSTP